MDHQDMPCARVGSADSLGAPRGTIDSASGKTAPPLCSERLSLLLPNSPAPIRVVQEVDSTNSALKRTPDAPHGTVLIAREQAGGRGRLGRSFFSPEGGLYLSMLLHPPQSDLLCLTPMAAVAVRRAIADFCGVSADIKWINDLVFDGKKLGGILAERVIPENTPSQQTVILGIGINCRAQAFPPSLRGMAVSLAEILGRPIDLNTLAAAVIRRLQELGEVLLTQKSVWMEEYTRACITLGKPVRILRGEESTEAFAEGIDEDGGLIVRLKNGTQTTVRTGEVSVRGLYGYL